MEPASQARPVGEPEKPDGARALHWDLAIGVGLGLLFDVVTCTSALWIMGALPGEGPALALIASCAVACLLGFPLARLSARVRWVTLGVFLLRPMLLAWYLLVSLTVLMDAIGFGVLGIEGSWARDLMGLVLLLLLLDLLWGLSLATPTLIHRHRRLQNRPESGPGASHR